MYTYTIQSLVIKRKYTAFIHLLAPHHIHPSSIYVKNLYRVLLRRLKGLANTTKM